MGKTIDNDYDCSIGPSHKIKEMDTTGMTQTNVNQQTHIQQNNSDRFTSRKKTTIPLGSKLNKFSSSGIGNFQLTNSNHLPPISPSP